MMDRRKFLQQAGIFSLSAIASVGVHGWVARATPSKHQKRLVVIFLRGGVDGLNVVVPYREKDYYQARSKIAIPQPGEKNGALDLDGNFGLHPALAPILPLWQQGNLAFVHACGSPDSTRSHFDAQYYMESGTPGVKTTADGWMNRLLALLSDHTPIQAVSISATIPYIFKGRMAVANIALGNNAVKPIQLDQPAISTAFDQLYSSREDALGKTYQEGRMARQALLSNFQAEMKMANNGAPQPSGFAKNAQRLAQLMVKDPRVQLVFLELGGWDTHINQGNSTKGQLATNLQSFGQGLATLQRGLGSVYADTTILVMSEFGRTLHENDNGGTDHGYGNVIWVLGGSIRGGKIYGKWSGLSTTQLYQGRDLAVTTDFRDVFTTVLQQHLQINDTKLNQVFPNYTPTEKIALF